MKLVWAIVFLNMITQLAFAETLIAIGQGKDGATGSEFPTKDSIKQSLEVYNSVKVKQYEASSFDMEFDEDNFSIRLLKEKHEVQVEELGGSTSIIGIKMKYADISFSGPAADYLFKNLTVKDTGRIGSSEKEAGNLTCSKSVTLHPKVKCTLKGTAYLSLNY